LLGKSDDHKAHDAGRVWSTMPNCVTQGAPDFASNPDGTVLQGICFVRLVAKGIDYSLPRLRTSIPIPQSTFAPAKDLFKGSLDLFCAFFAIYVSRIANSNS